MNVDEIRAGFELKHASDSAIRGGRFGSPLSAANRTELDIRIEIQ